MTDEEIAEVANRLSKYFAEALLDTPQDDAFVAKATALMTGPIAAAIRDAVTQIAVRLALLEKRVKALEEARPEA